MKKVIGNKFSFSKFKSLEDFLAFIDENKELGLARIEMFKDISDSHMNIEIKLFNRIPYREIYLNMKDNILFYDDDVYQLDIENYTAYHKERNTFQLITPIKVMEKIDITNFPKESLEMISLLDNKTIYNFTQLKDILFSVFEKYELSTSDKNIGKYLTTFCDKTRVQVKGKKEQRYQLKV